ncbi:MAG: ABC transporter substrate-binding protein [Actinomycetota bacterium]|nr:ABC transporter substrate-binding protein [Actinomycetota bacterium]
MLALAACLPRGPEREPSVAAAPEAVTVGSFNFSESTLLAEVYAQALEGVDLPVARELEVGPRELMQPALEQGLVDVVPEYLGSALAYFDPGAAVASLDARAIHQRLVDTLGRSGVAVLAPAPAQNQNGFAVTPATAERYGLRTISDLAPVAGELVFGGPPECRERRLCLAGLQSRYGLQFADFVALDSGGRRTRAALAQGQVDVALLFTTDGHLATGEFVLLADDRQLQPAENVVPVVRRQTIERYGDRLVERLNQVSAALTTEDLSQLNRRVDIDGEDPVAVAGAWLEDEGLAG